MSDPRRYDELLGRLLDEELTEAEGAELATLVRDRPDLHRDLRHHLQLWELCSQQHSPERSAEAFLAAVRTRLRAEAEGDRFLDSVRDRLSGGDAGRHPVAASPTTRPRAAAFWRRPSTLAWAASVAAILLVATLWLAPPESAQAVETFEGEVVCRACMLDECPEHLPALRVTDAGGTRIYRLSGDPAVLSHVGNYCAKPIPVTAVGRASIADGHLEVTVHTCIRSEPPPPDPEPPVLFPF